MRISYAIAGFGFLLMQSSTALAQEVDYSALEELFGEPVTISATGKPQRVSETPVSMEIITEKDIRNSGAMDIPQLLRGVAGVEVERVSKGHADVNIRGYNQTFSNRLLVLINGRQVYQDVYGTTLWNSLPVQLNEIKQIEVIRGPNSSLYGFNAASGVVNIITHSPLADDSSFAQVRAGTQGHREFSLAKTLSFSDDFAVRFSGGGLRSDEYDYDKAFTSTISEEDDLMSGGLNVDALWQLSDVQSLRVETGYNKAQLMLNMPFNVPSPFYSINRHYNATYTHEVSEGVFTARAYRNELNNKTEANAFTPLIIPPTHNNLNVFQLSYLHALDADHTLRIGTDYRNNEIQSDMVGAFPSRFVMDVYAVNGMWSWQISDKLSWTNSARLDYWKTDRDGAIRVVDNVLPTSAAAGSRDELDYSFNSGLLYKYDNKSDYRLSVARGLRIPSLIELSQDIPNTLYEVYGNPYLEPESNLSFELGHNRLLRGGEDKTELFTNLYYMKHNNVLFPISYPITAVGGGSGSSIDFTYDNVGNSDAYGMEIGLKGQLLEKKLQWGVNYSYITLDDDRNALATTSMTYEDSQPAHKVNLLATYQTGLWTLHGDVHYVSEVDNYTMITGNVFTPAYVTTRDDYWLINGSIGYQATDNITLSLSGYNLLDRHQERPSYMPLAPIENFRGGNELGRTVLFSVTGRF